MSNVTAGRREAKVLLVVVETRSLSFRADRIQKEDIIATVLFGDGSAAACISSTLPTSDNVVSLGQGHQQMWPDTLDIIGWDVDETGFGVVFDRFIPSFITKEFAAAATQGALKAANLNHTDIDRYVCHSGGAKVVDAIEGALHLKQGPLDAERDTLRAAGNISVPTVMFVMKSVIDAGKSGQMMACALTMSGPTRRTDSADRRHWYWARPPLRSIPRSCHSFIAQQDHGPEVCLCGTNWTFAAVVSANAASSLTCSTNTAAKLLAPSKQPYDDTNIDDPMTVSLNSAVAAISLAQHRELGGIRLDESPDNILLTAKKGSVSDMADPFLNERNSFGGRLTYARFPSSYLL